MIHLFKKRRDAVDEGFTLIELMVVVLIIAILLAIAVPTFLGARDRANDRAAQSSLRNALTAAKGIYADAQDYSKATDVALDGVEPSLVFELKTVPSASFKSVSVDGGTATSLVWIGAAKSKSGKCFFIRDDTTATVATAGTRYFKSTALACQADAAPVVASFSPETSVGW